MAEFALVLAPCLLLFLAIMNFALALYSYDWVCYSAQQAVRYATVNGTTAAHIATSTDVHNYVNGLVVGVLNPTLLTVTTTWAPNNKPGSVVTVAVTYNFPALTQMISSASIPLTRTAAMVITQ